MKRLEIPAGTVFGELKVIREAELSASGKRQILCQCACGQKATVRLGHLRSGHSTTCGKCGIEYKGQRKTIREWASLYGLKESTLRARLKTMGIEEALARK